MLGRQFRINYDQGALANHVGFAHRSGTARLHTLTGGKRVLNVT